MVPAPGAAHSLIAQQLAVQLDGPARGAGLVVSVDFNLGAGDDWRALRDGEYVPIERSALIDLDPRRLAAKIDWPPTD